MNTQIETEITAPSTSTLKETEVQLKALTFYQQELKRKLPAHVFERTPGRTVYFVSFHIGYSHINANISILQNTYLDVYYIVIVYYNGNKYGKKSLMFLDFY